MIWKLDCWRSKTTMSLPPWFPDSAPPPPWDRKDECRPLKPCSTNLTWLPTPSDQNEVVHPGSPPPPYEHTTIIISSRMVTIIAIALLLCTSLTIGVVWKHWKLLASLRTSSPTNNLLNFENCTLTDEQDWKMPFVTIILSYKTCYLYYVFHFLFAIPSIRGNSKWDFHEMLTYLADTPKWVS